jgi:hypothetical protein
VLNYLHLHGFDDSGGWPMRNYYVREYISGDPKYVATQGISSANVAPKHSAITSDAKQRSGTNRQKKLRQWRDDWVTDQPVTSDLGFWSRRYSLLRVTIDYHSYT